MARKNDLRPIAKDDPSRIIQTSVEDVLHQSMIPYAEHVILERAIPRVEDGLKPVQRRVLYTMHELGIMPDKPHRKCARIVGDCLGKYHPHGDSSVYEALVRMAQDFSMRGPLVDGHGNFGSIDGDGAAAMRYTEARLAPLAMLMLRDIEKDTVSFRLNFDDSLKEPDMLPARFPNLLVNGASGIAVGLATNIPPHNLGETIRAAIARIEDPEISLEDLMQILPGPDFPTGGVLIANDEIRTGYETGRSRLTLRARVHIEDGGSGRKLIVVTEVPYQVNKAAMLEKILKLSEEKKAALGCIYDIRDESDRTGMRAVIELKRDADPERVLAYLYKYSDLQITFGVNMVAIADGKPVQMGLQAMLDCFINHQKDVVTRRTEYDLAQARARAHILQGLMIAVDNLDEVIRLIRASRTPKDARIALMENFPLDEAQAQAILDMRLQRLTNLEIDALRREFEELKKTIARLEGILASEKKLLSVIVKELRDIEKEFADERRTLLEAPSDAPADILSEKAEAEPAAVVFTRGGQLKRVDPGALRRTPLPLMTEDPLESARYIFETDTDAQLLIFTDIGNCYGLPVSMIAPVKPKDRGQLLSGLLKGLEDGETAVHMLCVHPEELAAMPDLVFVTKTGAVKRTAAAEYAVRSKKFAAIGLKSQDSVVSVFMIDGNNILMITRDGMCIRFPDEGVPAQGRTAGGVRGMQLAPGDGVVWAGTVGNSEEIAIFSDRGCGKRVPSVAFEPQNRAGKGVRAFVFNKTGTNGKIVAGVCRVAQNPVVVFQKKSPMTVIPPEELAAQDRNGRGMPYVMALMDDIVTEAATW